MRIVSSYLFQPNESIALRGREALAMVWEVKELRF